MRSRPVTACSPTWNQGVVSRVSQTIEYNSAMRVTIASPSPVSRAASWRAGGSRPTRIAMKIRLSMPRTISSSASVMNANQVCGSARNSIMAVSAPTRVYGRWSMAAFFSDGNTCSAVNPQSSAMALEM